MFNLSTCFVIKHLFCIFKLFVKKELIYFIIRINPTTSSLEVFPLEKKNLGHITQIIGPILDVTKNYIRIYLLEYIRIILIY